MVIFVGVVLLSVLLPYQFIEVIALYTPSQFALELEFMLGDQKGKENREIT